MSKKILTLDNVPVINKKIGKIDTIEKLKASTIYSIGDVVEVLGFHAKGDGSHHKRIAKDKDDGSGEQGQNGIWWNILHNGEVNVSWFGMSVEGGVLANNFELLQKIANMESVIKINFPKGRFIIEQTGTITINRPITIEGSSLGNYDSKNCILITGSSTDFLFSSNYTISFKYIYFYGNSNNSFLKNGSSTTQVNNSILENVWVSNFDKGFVFEKCWDTKINNLNTFPNIKEALCFSGKSVNLSVVNSSISASSVCLRLGDGVTAGEGFMMSNTLLSSANYGILINTYSHVHISNCIIDLMKINCVQVTTGGVTTSTSLQIDNSYLGLNSGGEYCLKVFMQNDPNSMNSGSIYTNNKFVLYGEAKSFFTIGGAEKGRHYMQGNVFYSNSNSTTDTFLGDGVSILRDSFLKMNTTKKFGSTNSTNNYPLDNFTPSINDSIAIGNVEIKTAINSEADLTNNYSLGFFKGLNNKGLGMQLINGKAYPLVSIPETKPTNLRQGNLYYESNRLKLWNGVSVIDIGGHGDHSTTLSLDTPYYTLKMQEQGIYEEYVAYRDELHEYENSQTSDEAMLLPVLHEPVIPDSIRAFAEKYKLI